jgi:hypothetical protein
MTERDILVPYIVDKESCSFLSVKGSDEGRGSRWRLMCVH